MLAFEVVLLVVAAAALALTLTWLTSLYGPEAIRAQSTRGQSRAALKHEILRIDFQSSVFDDRAPFIFLAIGRC